MKKLAIAAAAFVASAQVGIASCGGVMEPACAVPEISALQGTAAIAAVAAVVLLVWERSRRAA